MRTWLSLGVGHENVAISRGGHENVAISRGGA